MNLDRLIKQNYLTFAVAILKDLADKTQQKDPRRTDLIESLSGTAANLSESYLDYKRLEIEMCAANRRNFDLELILLQKETELIELRKQNEELRKGL